jgi:carboxypeptidase family protein
MRGPLRPSLIALAILSVAAGAKAADTGSISGGVFDQKGQPVPNATVKVSGEQLPLGRTVETGANGTYEFEYLVPAEYTVEVDSPGIGRTRRVAVVQVGKDTQVDLIVGLVVNEALVVAAVRPIVDTRTAEVSFNVTSDIVNSLPIERTYRGLFQLIPGVADNRSQIGPAAGGSRQDNTYLIDGANITSPGFGYLATDVSELDIAEVNLKRAGITAEFGRTSGTVLNAVSRSGSNRFSGIGRIDWLSKQMVDVFRLPDELRVLGVMPGAFRDALLRTEKGAAVGLGGPVVRDHLFFYGSARYSRQTKWDRLNRVGTAMPDEVRTVSEFFGKVTAVPAGSQHLVLSYRHRPHDVRNAALTADAAPSVATDIDNSGRIATAEWASFMTVRRSLNVRYLYSRETNEEVPITNLGLLPAFDPTNLSSMGQYTDPLQANLVVGGGQFANIQNYRRHEVRATVTQLFDVGKSSHSFKAGSVFEFAEEHFNRIGNGWGTITEISMSGVPALRTRYYMPQAPQRGQGLTYSIFAQDDVTVGKRIFVNAGVLLNRDDFSQVLKGSGGCPSTGVLQGGAAVYESSGDRCTFLRFGFGDEIQPRVGVAFQTRPEQGDKAYANWGRYYNLDQKSSSRSLAPRRIFQTQTIFDLRGAILSTGPLASTTGKLIDPAIEPTYTDEIVVGYATPFGSDYSLDVFFMSRSLSNVIEDVPSRLSGAAPDSGPYVAANLPCAAFAACQSADARRAYRALTVDVRRRLSNGWMSDVSYTWSRLTGNFDLDFDTRPVFNTSSILQDAPGTNVEDPNRSGPLFEDRPHILKVFSSYAVTSRLTASGYLRVQSGTPWAARGRDWAGATLNYLEPAGSRRNPTWANLDLLGAYRLPFAARGATVSLEGRLLNVFNNQTRLSTDALQYLDLRTLPAPPYFAPYVQPNPFFGTGNAFAPPRRLYVAMVVSY